jgi:hypothetical protein
VGTIITVDGEERFLEGWDLEEVEAKAQAEYGVSIFTNTTADNTIVERSSLAKRVSLAFLRRSTSNTDQESQNCNVHRWGLLAQFDISAGLSTLHNTDRCIVQARQCIRTTCHGNSAIVWCNDNHYALNYPCSTIANMAFNAQWGCYKPPSELPYPGLESQQRFHDTEGWNVILGNCHMFSPNGQPVKA